jgi:putative transposase
VSQKDRLEMVANIKQTQDSGGRIKEACDVSGIGVRTFERWRKTPTGDQRRGPNSIPANKFSEAERVEVLAVANSLEYRDKSPAQIVPQLADKGIYLASESSFYRILKVAGQNAHRSRSKPASRSKPRELVASAPHQIFSWDITFLKSNIAGMFFYLYLVVDIYSRKIVGFEVYDTQTSEHASEMIAKICRQENINPNEIILHSDNGKPMKGATMLATLQRLGIVPSFSRPSVSDDNPFSEALFRTLKYCPKYPSQPFESAESAFKWVLEFVRWYNEEHLHSGINFVTPSSRHSGTDQSILAERHKVYQAARSKRPERWSGTTRNWDHTKEVFLNCLKKKTGSCNKEAA